MLPHVRRPDAADRFFRGWLAGGWLVIAPSVAWLSGCIIGCCPVLRRAKTPLANFVTGMVVMLTLLVLTPIFTHMSANVQVRAAASGLGYRL